MRVAVALTTLLVLAALSPGVVAQQPDQTTLTVTVETAGGSPIQGAELTATWDGGESTATTAANGKAFVDVAAGARVELSVSDDTYARNFPVIVADADEQEVTIEMRRSGSVSVRVVNTEGQPIQDAGVVLRQDGRDVSRLGTDADGRASFDDLERGTYDAIALKNGHYVNTTTLRVGGGTSKRIVLEEGSEQVTFEVFDAGTDEPTRLTDVTVTVGDRATVRTADSNTASIGLPVNTGFPVAASKEGYVTNETDIYVGEGGETVRLLLTREPALNVTATNERVVAGESVRIDVLDEYGDPVSGATVSVDGQQVATTDDRGVATVPIDETGSREITVATDELSATITVEGVQEATPSTPADATATTAVEGTPSGGIPLPGFTPVGAGLAVLALGGLLALRRR
jgi:MYXO-CTERM domain-containing protein